MPSHEMPRCEHEKVKGFLFEHGIAAHKLGDLGDNCSKNVVICKMSWRFPKGIALRMFYLSRSCLNDVMELGVT